VCWAEQFPVQFNRNLIFADSAHFENTLKSWFYHKLCFLENYYNDMKLTCKANNLQLPAASKNKQNEGTREEKEKNLVENSEKL